MNAAVYHGPGDIRIEERPEPEAREDNLVAEVICCAICGTDVKLATIGHPRWKPPVIIGHEFCGRLVHVGRETHGFAVGDRITMATTLACNRCHTCALGLQNMCPDSKPISMIYDGAFAPAIAIPPLALAGGNVVKVPDGMLDEAAALAEPLSCAINAQELAGVRAGYTVLVVGGGPLGALHGILARARGTVEVMIVQRSEPRLSLLRKIPGVRVIDGAHEDVSGIIRECTGGLGADVAIVCAPSRQAQEESIRHVRKGGAVSLFASLPKDEALITMDSRAIHYGELRIIGASDSRPEHVREAVELMAGEAVDVSVAITHRLPLSRIREGLELMKNKQSLKVMLYPDEGSRRAGII